MTITAMQLLNMIHHLQSTDRAVTPVVSILAPHPQYLKKTKNMPDSMLQTETIIFTYCPVANDWVLTLKGTTNGTNSSGNGENDETLTDSGYEDNPTNDIQTAGTA